MIAIAIDCKLQLFLWKSYTLIVDSWWTAVSVVMNFAYPRIAMRKL